MSFIKLQMFKDQNGKKRGYSESAALPPPQFKFGDWKAGYFVRSNNPSVADEWKIEQIESADGKMHNEECVVTIKNTAGETRTLKGASLRAGYQFASVGDVVEPASEKLEEVVPAREDVQYLTVNVAGIREYYARKHGYEGSRVLMMDKTAYIVADTPSVIDQMIGQLGWTIVGNR